MGETVDEVRAQMAEIAADIAVDASNRAATLLARIAELETAVAEYDHCFDQAWSADMRGVELWRAGHPDRVLVLPDRAKLVEWLLERLDVAERGAREVRVYRHQRSGDWCPYQDIIHKADDTEPTSHGERIQLSDTLTAGLLDGDEIEVIVRATGRKLTTRWELRAPHEYGPTETPTSAGCPRCRAAFGTGG